MLSYLTIMDTITLNETKIDSLVSSYKEAEKIIIGSDEHLDIILHLQKTLDEIIKLSIDVNNGLDDVFNNLDKESAKNTVIKLSTGLQLSRHLIVSFKRTHPSILEGIKSRIKALHIENKQIDEFIQDIIRYRINEPVELYDLLKSLS